MCVRVLHVASLICSLPVCSLQCGSSMAPKVKAAARAKPAPKPKALVVPAPKRGPTAKPKAPWVTASNDRNLRRRAAVALMNGLAREVGVRPIRVKSKNVGVERLVRLLEARCQCGDLPARLRAAAASYLAAGGVFSTPLMPSTVGPDDADGDGVDGHDGDAPPHVQRHRLLEVGFQLNSKAFMLTYNSASFGEATWPAFLAWVRGKRKELGASRWAACLEKSEHASGGAAAPARCHMHVYLWWTDGVGLRRRNTDDLVFHGVRPRVDVCTCTASRGRTLRLAAAQGLWYVTVEKCGTISVAGNFWAWRDYVPRAEWYRGLWEAHKLTHEMYAAFSRKLRSHHSDRKRDLVELEADERRRAVLEHVAKELASLKTTGAFQPMRAFPEVEAFVQHFEGGSRMRRPILAIVGGTNLGKSVLAASVLERVGTAFGLTDFLEITVEDDAFLDLTDLDIRRHAGVLLDGVGDVKVLQKNREVIQGRPKAQKAGKSQAMRFSSVYTLCRRAVVVTFDLSAANLDMLESDHWLSNPNNVILLKLASPAWATAAATPAPAAEPQPRDAMKSFSVDRLGAFLRSRDLAGPASSLFASGVDGADMLDMTQELLVKELRLTGLAARKVLRARDAFLAGHSA